MNFVDDQNLEANSLEQPNHGELHVDGSGAQTLVDAQRVQNLGEQLAFAGPPRQLDRQDLLPLDAFARIEEGRVIFAKFRISMVFPMPLSP